MKNRIILIIFLFTFLFIKTVDAVVYTGETNPGTGGGGATAGAGDGTKWGGSIRAIRVRVFRNGTSIASGYYSLAEKEEQCKSSISAKLCETTSYNYSKVTDSANATCASSATQITISGCIVSNNLLSTFEITKYNGTYLDNHLSANSYKNLKDVLKGIGYDDSIAQDGDIVIIEPATRVTCNDNYYFGTSTAMMMQNVSYRGSSSNKCAGSDNNYGTSSKPLIGYTFQNLFRSMSTALKVSSYSKWQGNKTYTGFGYFKYNVSDMGYNPPPENKKYKVDTNIVVNGNIMYSGFNDKNYGKAKFTIGGVEVFNGAIQDYYADHDPGTSFSLENIETYPGSEYTYIGYSIGSYTSPINDTHYEGTTPSKALPIVFHFSSTSCESQLTNIISTGKSVESLFNLYWSELEKGHDYRGLLNINSPSCTTKSIPDKEIENLSCLSGSTLSHENFNELNLTDYDEIASDGLNNVGFCLTSLNLENNLGVQKFYSKAGRLLVSQVDDNSEIKIYNSEYNPVIVNSSDVATATVTKKCYVLANKNINHDLEDTIVNLYFGDNDLDGDVDELRTVSPSQDSTPYISATNNGLKLYEYEKKFNYKLNKIYLYPISGKYVSTGNNALNGIISKFNANSGGVPFNIKFITKLDGDYEVIMAEGKTVEGNDLCQYETKSEIIVGNKLNLEFRVIDTTNPFNRNTMSNWSYGTDNSKDNDIVKNYILNATNSYGIKKGAGNQTPKYTITLTQTEIKNIREYNKSVVYDNYKVDCDVDSNGNQVCKNTFLENLKSRKVIIYDEFGNVIKTLINTKKLN